MKKSKYYMFTWLIMGIMLLILNLWLGLSWVVSGYIMDRWYRVEGGEDD